MNKKIVVVGSLNIDLVVTVVRNPLLGETISGHSFQRFVGGKGANQAAAASLLGGCVRMIARHGNDSFAMEILSTLRDCGVETSGIAAADESSGTAVILVTEDGGSSIVVVPGSNSELLSEYVEQRRGDFDQAGIILTQLETPLVGLEKVLEIASEKSIPVILDPAPVRYVRTGALEKISWLTPNVVEAAQLLGHDLPSDTSACVVAEALMRLGAPNVLLKLGEKGAFVAAQTGIREFVPAPQVNAVDSTGAGDALNGAFAYALMEGSDPVEAARFGVQAASLSVTRIGAISSLPTLDEVVVFREQHSSLPFPRAEMTRMPASNFE